jgi:site-specific DNA-cytosine methylase
VPTYSIQGSGATSKTANGSGYNKEISFTLNSTDVHGVAQPVGAFNIAPGKGALKDDIHITDATVTKTLDAFGSNPAMHQGGAAIIQATAMAVAQPMVYDTTNITSPTNGSNPKPGDPCFTLAKGQHPPLLTNMEIKPTVIHGTQDPCVSDIAFAQGRNNGGENVLCTSMAVRRLTPVECERLQGFHDNYTDIQPKSKPTPDGPRYKALGNSMAVPVMKWIGERINMVENLS